MNEKLVSIAEIREQLITTDKGAVKQCIRNVVTVLQNDPKFKGVIRYNMMTDRNDIVKDLGACWLVSGNPRQSGQRWFYGNTETVGIGDTI